MKIVRALFLGVSILICSQSYAQKVHRPLPGDGGEPTTPPAAGELFAGEWEWSSGGEIFHLTLVRNPTYAFPDGETTNAVIGQYSFFRNGILIDQSPATGPRPYALFCVPANNRSMHMIFKDNAKNKYAYAELTLITGQPDELIWKIEPMERMYFDGDVIPSAGYTVPTSVTLTRQ